MPESPLRESQSRHSVLFGLLVCFFLSGSAGLIYQVAWSKSLGLIFGHTAYAVATVLAVFMGGLAAGSAVLGRWSEHNTRPIASYAWLELGVAASGALSLAGLAGVRAVYIAAYPHAAGQAAALVALRFVGAALVLFIPTFLMGGTLPVLVRGLTRHSTELGTRVARLYWVNTAGAVAGTLVAGFLILPTLGLRHTVEIAVGLNVLAGALALGLSRAQLAAPVAGGSEASAEPGTTSPSAPGSADSPSRFLLICFAVVGGSAMAYEIGWTRLLATQLGSSTYAFTLMLATFLAGIVMGSAIFEIWSRRYQPTRMTFALTQTFTGLAALAFLLIFPYLAEVLPRVLRLAHDSFRGVVLAQFVVSALAMLPTALVFGFNFPAVTALIAGRDSSSGSGARAVGRAYAWNTLGAIVGATATGFWLLPALGSFHLLAATAAANVILAAVLSLSVAPRRIIPRRILAFVANAALVVVIAFIGFSSYVYDPSVAAFNTLLYWNFYDAPEGGRSLTPRENARSVDIVYFADGLNSTITVARTENYISLRTNGKVDASNHDQGTQLMMAHLGALSHPPHRVLVIGFGSGMTVSALARYPELERLDCVEIEPAVLGAAPILTQLNRNVLADPRVHIIFDDARNYILTTQEHYDLIVSEPSNPWIAGVATLFTREFYQAVQTRLTLGGVFVQWVQAYSLYPEDLRMVVATFLSEFQNASLWRGDESDLFLMAPSPSSSDLLKRAQMLYSNPLLHKDFKKLGMDEPAGLFAFYLLNEPDLRNFSEGAPINTDDLTLLEYHAPRSLRVRGLEKENRGFIHAAQEDVLPADLPPDQRDQVLGAVADTFLNLEDLESANRILAHLDGRPVTATIAIDRGRALLSHGDYESASRAFDAALALDPSSIEAAWGRAEADRRTVGNTEKAREEFLRLLDRDPTNLAALQSLIKLDTDFGRWPEVLDLQKRLIDAADPDAAASLYAQLAEYYVRAGDNGRAYGAAEDALARDPYNYKARTLLGMLLAIQHRWTDARDDMEFVRRYFPSVDGGTYVTLYKVYQALGDPAKAAEAARFGLGLFPDNEELQGLNHAQEKN